jgi:branched-chain amino acid transport system ATP-binding protein
LDDEPHEIGALNILSYFRRSKPLAPQAPEVDDFGDVAIDLKTIGGEINGTYLDIASSAAPEKKTRSKAPERPPRERSPERQPERPPQFDRQPERQPERPPERQFDRQPERQPERQAERQPAPQREQRPPRPRRRSEGNGAFPGGERRGVLAVHGVEKSFVGRMVVKGVSLYVRKGEAVGLLGPNGAGKTTTLETIAGLNRAISGQVKLSGEDVSGVPAHTLARRGLALVPEGRALFPGLTVREHLRLAGGRSGPREGELLEMLPELQKCLHRKAGLLSGGEQQMLAIGRALVTRPRLLLVDEMSLGLAPVIVERLLPILRRVADEYGTSVLFVEQHVALALEISDRAYVLSHGRIALEGAAAQLRERRELLAASYLGEAAAA